MKIELEEDEAGIDLAPLLDCIFLLLIFFMISTTFYRGERSLIDLPLKLPRVSSSLEGPRSVASEPIEISVSENGEMWLRDQPTDLTELQMILREEVSFSRDRAVVIAGDRQAAFEQIVRVLDLCHLLGVQNVSLRAEKHD